MNIFEIAIEMEIEGAAYYTKLANKAVNEGLKSIFTLLAADENKHQAIFEAFQADASLPTDALATSELQIKDILATFKSDRPKEEESQLQAYESALEIELKSIEFYSEYADTLKSGRESDILDFIIKEERRHYDLLDSIIEMVKRPQTWVENAEFGKRETY
jgi:rubrerythrin